MAESYLQQHLALLELQACCGRLGNGTSVLVEPSVAEMMAQVADPGPQLHASYLGVDPVGPVGQLEQSNLAYGDPQVSCLEQAAAGNHIPAEGVS